MDAHSIRSMREREFRMIPVDEIKVLNSRDRDEEQFRENIRSIDQVGLRKPVISETGLGDMRLSTCSRTGSGSQRRAGYLRAASLAPVTG